MAPKSILGIEYFPHFSAPVPQGVFWKVPCLILAPFCLHFGRFWHPFGSTWVASGTFFVSIFDNFALTLFYFGTRARRAPDSAAAPAVKTKETSLNNLYFAQHLSHPTQSGTLPLATSINRQALTCQFRHPLGSMLVAFGTLLGSKCVVFRQRTFASNLPVSARYSAIASWLPQIPVTRLLL